jgi:hypothetical protein
MRMSDIEGSMPDWRYCEDRSDRVRAANEFQRPKRRTSLLHAFAVFDNQVDPLQEVDVTQHIALDGDDIGKLAFAD